MLPFAIVGSEKSVVIDGKPVRGRKNRWGVINVEDERHCEFVYLRNFLTRCVSFCSLFPLTLCGFSAGSSQSLASTSGMGLEMERATKLMGPDPPAGPDRDDVADPLRDVPLQAAHGAQRVVRQAAAAIVCVSAPASAHRFRAPRPHAPVRPIPLKGWMLTPLRVLLELAPRRSPALRPPS